MERRVYGLALTGSLTNVAADERSLYGIRVDRNYGRSPAAELGR